MDPISNNSPQSSLPTIPPPNQTDPLSKNSFPKLLIVAVVILVLVIISSFTAYFAAKSRYANPIPIATPALNPTQSPTPNETSNLKTYTNNKYGYGFKYPIGWQIYPPGSDKTTADSVHLRLVNDNTPAAETGFIIGVLLNPKNLLLSQLCKTNQSDFFCAQKVTAQFITINNLNWEILGKDAVSLPPTGYILYDIPHNGYLFYINVYSADKNVIDQILSTFKFTEQKQTDITAGWKTYASPENTYTFRYPPNWILSSQNGPIASYVMLQCDNCSPVNLFQVTPSVYKSVDEYLSKFTPITDTQKIQFKGLEAVKGVVPGGPQAGGSSLELFVVSKGQGYSIGYRFGGLLNINKVSDLPAADPDILSTFKFL